MTTIRTQIDAHSPIVAERTDDGRAIISIEDLNELCELAHEAVHPKDYSIPSEQITNEHGAQRLLDAIFAVDTEGEIVGYGDVNVKFDAPEEEPEEEPEIDYREVQIRNLAMQYALGYVTTQINAAHGLDTAAPDLIGHAESILNFLKG